VTILIHFIQWKNINYCIFHQHFSSFIVQKMHVNIIPIISIGISKLLIIIPNKIEKGIYMPNRQKTFINMKK